MLAEESDMDLKYWTTELLDLGGEVLSSLVLGGLLGSFSKLGNSMKDLGKLKIKGGNFEKESLKVLEQFQKHDRELY